MNPGSFCGHCGAVTRVGALYCGSCGTPAVAGASAPAAPVVAEGVVPIESLYYRGRAALDRAREVRDLLRAQDGAPDRELLAELYDLLDLAAAD